MVARYVITDDAEENEILKGTWHWVCSDWNTERFWSPEAHFVNQADVVEWFLLNANAEEIRIRRTQKL